jgi:hypothetical protein
MIALLQEIAELHEHGHALVHSTLLVEDGQYLFLKDPRCFICTSSGSMNIREDVPRERCVARVVHTYSELAHLLRGDRSALQIAAVLGYIGEQSEQV